MHFIWVTPPVSNCFHLYEDYARMFDKLLRALVSFDTSISLRAEMEWLMLHGPPQYHLSDALVWVQSVPNLI